jgi:carboxypeptidase-like protein/putative zinc finger protein
MQHLDEGTIHAWIDGELPPAKRAEAEAHIAECAECAAAVAEARGFVAASSRILTALDSVPGGVLPAASTGSGAVRRAVPRRFVAPRAWMAIAAVLVLSTVTVIAIRPSSETAQLRVAAAARDQKELPATAAPAQAEVRATKPSAAARAADTQAVGAVARVSPDSLAAAPAAAAAAGNAASAKAPAATPSRAAAPADKPAPVDQTERLKSRLDAERKSTLVRPEPAQPGASADAAPRPRAAEPQASANRASSQPAAPQPESVAEKDLAAKREAPAPVYESLSGKGAAANSLGVTITGRVTSEAGAPLSAASVSLQGTGVAAITGSDGEYTLVVPAARANGRKASLVAHLIGYKTTVDTIAPTNAPITHDFVLAANAVALGQVVITGEGTTSTSEKLGTSTDSDDAPRVLSRSTSTESGDSVVTTTYAVHNGTVTLVERSSVSDALRRQKGSADFSDQVMAKARDDARINSITWSDSSGRVRTLRGAVPREDLERIRTALFGPKP